MAGTSLLSAFSQLLPPGLPQPVVAGAQRLLGLDRLAAVYDTLQLDRNGGPLPGRLLRHLGVECLVSRRDLENIPSRGPVVIVANHPFGILEAAVLAELLPTVRPDVKFLANALMNCFEELRDILVTVDPFGSAGAERANLFGVKRSIEHLRSGGTLVIFPAGEVSHFQWKAGIADPEWHDSVARIARLGRATVVPLYIGGANSAWFHAAGFVHARLRTALLIRELLNKGGAKVDIRIGSSVAPARLAEMSDDQTRTRYLRWRTYLLGHRTSSTAIQTPAATARTNDLFYHELPRHPIVENSEFAVYLTPAAEIPGILREIGRLRETTFRAVGEGTGKSTDLDEFDAYYQHLFLWNKAAREIAGAYRLAPCDVTLARRGASGLYTATLFSFAPRFLERLAASAVELGRSFIRPEYQKSFAPLLLLWKGIGRFIAANPRYTTLFGPVSISNQYREMSRQLMVNFLERSAVNPDIAKWIATRHGYRPKLKNRARNFAHGGAGLLIGIEDLSAAVADLEPERRGVPVLLRQYLSLGGKLLAFNVDPNFSQALDGLIMVDLTQAQPRLLERVLGKNEARILKAQVHR
jgi:putative hemolysin